MDRDEEKAALEREREQGAQQSTDDDIAIDPHRPIPRRKPQETSSDPEKDAIRRQEIQNKHLSLASASDAHKRESIETAPRASTVLSDSDSASYIGDDDDQKNTPPAQRSGVSLQVPEGDPMRPPNSRGGTVASGMTVTSSRRSLPSLRRRETKLAQKEAHPWQHLGITLGLPMILIFDLVVPCIIYYVWYARNKPRQYNKDILGYSIISFGFGELWILIARVHRLFAHQQDCAPLISRSRWELDATSWVYGVSLIMGLIPFVVGSELEIPQLYLYSPSFIMAFLGSLMVLTTMLPIKIPIGINSQPRGTYLRPFIYYAAEDFIAVDGLQDREFRERYNDRYETNKMFRQFFFHLTLWWILGVVMYIGCASAIIWNLEFHYAFGCTFGVLFSWIAVWAGVTYAWVQWEMKREHIAYEEGEIEP